MAGYTGFDDIIAQSTAGKRIIIPFSKINSTAPVAAAWYHLWTNGGLPQAGAAYTGTALAFQRTTEKTTGAIAHGGNKSTATKHLLKMWAMASGGSTPPILQLVDMVGYYPLTQSASLQAFDNTTGPDRYVSAGDPGLQMVLVAGALGDSTASNISALNYTNQAGNPSSIPTSTAVAVTVSAAAPTGTLGSRVITTIGNSPYIPLAQGDTGVRSLTNITFSAANSGLEAILLVKPLHTFPCPAASVAGERDLVMQLPSLERIYDGACLSLLSFFAVATAANFTGEFEAGWN